MFDTQKLKYETKGINERLCVDYRIIMWDLIEKLSKEIELDYLQVFEFSIEDDNVQKIKHSQEVPEYEKTYIVPMVENGVTGKVFVIDDGDHCTMLWADEYQKGGLLRVVCNWWNGYWHYCSSCC